MTTSPSLPPDAADLRAHLDAFYDKVRRDAVLGPIFNAAVQDWPEHMETLTTFWRTVALRQPGYKGNPLAVHKALPLAPADFADLFPRWLALWRETAEERFPPDIAALLVEKAGRIAESLKAGLLFDPAQNDPAKDGPLRTA